MLAASALILAAEPARWLLQSWQAPGSSGLGGWVFAGVGALFFAAWRTPLDSRMPETPALAPQSGARRLGIALLCGTAAIRAIARLMDVQVLGALILGIDVVALASLARLGERRFAVAPLWLGALFLFCLPVEPIAQRLVGYSLQQISAAGACALLSVPFADLACEGVRLRLRGQDVLVDLPCSGSRLLSISGLLYTLIMSLRPLPPARALIFGGLMAGACALGNSLRISLLAMGIAFAEALPFAVMDPIPHGLVGLLVVALISGAAMGMHRCLARRVPAGRKPPPKAAAGAPGNRGCRSGLPRPTSPSNNKSSYTLPHLRGWQDAAWGLGLLMAAAGAAQLEADPFDATRPLPAPQPPLYAAGWLAQPGSLTGLEQRYFTRYGGSASKTRYGPYGLLLVQTSAPLRHLHEPSVCLSGLGFEVHFLGTRFEPVPSAIYSARRAGPDGIGNEHYQIEVTYVSDRGRQAASVSETVWHWLRSGGGTWTMVQRILPMTDDRTSAADDDHWRRAIERAFNLT